MARDQGVTIPDEGNLYFPTTVVDALRAYSVGRLWFDRDAAIFVPTERPPADYLRVRVAQVKVDGVWVPL